jgi:protein-S-isoprenylcysteine O-methyltransferase Ste14
MPSAAASEYIADRGFHLRGFIGGLSLGTCGAAVVASAPAIAFGPLARSGFVAAGWLLFIFGIGLRFWSTLYVGGRKVGGRREAKLVVDGPYSIVRNPLYLGSLLIGLSTVCFLHSGVLAVAVALAAVHYLFVTIPAEEHFLRRLAGGEAFDAYAARTPRLLPNWSLYQAEVDGDFYTKALRNEARRCARLLAVPLALTLLAAARYEPWWPTWFRLP